MDIEVELFGIARARAGIARARVEGTCLGDVFIELAQRFPGLANTCIEGRRLRPGFTANLGGDRFTTSPDTPVRENETVLILSLDAGG
jgi:sulfur-carrier protein